MVKGSCLCKGVSFSLTGDLRQIIACHCGQCRKTSGHFWAATSVKDETLVFDRTDSLQWFRSSETTKRGFCGNCGSSLFWKPLDQDRTVIAAGALDDTTGLGISAHVFCVDKGDYYDLPTDIPCFDHFSGVENA